MLSYRHAFHAGNHADVLKHMVLVQVLEYLRQKGTGFSYVDTHAGAGCYDLQSAPAQKNAEFAAGVGRLWTCTEAPELVSDYLAVIRRLNPDGLKRYPGSPWIAAESMRPQDHLCLFELHPSDYQLLQHNLGGKRRRIEQQDGFQGLCSCLPPATRRGLSLIDPAYETKEDYQRVVTTLQAAIKRFSRGVYILWYPLLPRVEARALQQQLATLAISNSLQVQLRVAAASESGFGMYGSGLYVINPPWLLAEQLRQSLPFLLQHLAEDAAAGFDLQVWE